MAVIDQLERAEGLTETERELALYVLAHADEVTELSISELADRSFTSNATIVRLCRKLGMKGYRDFRIELSKDVERRRGARDVNVNAPFGSSDELADIMNGVAAVQKEAIDACYAALPRIEIRRAALAISRAKRVFVFGQGDSRISVTAFANQLLKLGVFCVDAARFDESLAQASASEPGDVAIIASYSGRLARSLADAIDIFHSHRCKVVLVSAGDVTEGIDIHLRFPAREDASSNIATFYSQECLRYTLNCVYAQLFALDYERNQALKAEVDALTSQGA